MTAVTVKGLAALRRLAAQDLSQAFAEAVRQEAESLAEAARAGGSDVLKETVEIRDESRKESPAYTVGTSHPAARFLEFGTARRQPTPWLMPLFWRVQPPSRIGCVDS